MIVVSSDFLRFDLLRRAFQFDDQVPPGHLRISSVDGFFRGVDGQPIHDLHRTGQQPRGDHLRHGIARLLDRTEAASTVWYISGLGSSRR